METNGAELQHLLLLLTTRLPAHFSVWPNGASQFTSLPIN